jgi:hypothetical protein
LGSGAANPREVIFLVAISFLFISGNSILVDLHTAEIYPTPLRSLGTGAASVRRVFVVWIDLARRPGNILQYGGNPRACARGNLALK